MKEYNVGYCAGVYDLFHIGHVNLFRRAKEKCETLIVGVLTDELVIHFKKNPPYIPFEERLQMVESCRYVDRAIPVTFDNIGKIDAWDQLHYDCFFSGDDYSGNEVWMKEKRLLNERGSDIYFFSYTQTTSSTKIKQAIEAQIRKEM
ncbi:MAG: adenylyltransferase/cytidyltransferase family protein [Lachnospiraceae bacterium]